MERESTVIQLRPHIDTIKVSAESSVMEYFQNKTLRPILKLQHQSLVTTFEKLTFGRFTTHFTTPKEKSIWIKTLLSNDAIMRNILIGMVLGMMTSEELSFFFEHQKVCRQRLVVMLVERLGSNI